MPAYDDASDPVTGIRPVRPHLSYLVTGLGGGGAEAELVGLVRALAGRGWPVEVVSLLPGGTRRAELLAAGIPCRDLAMWRGRPSFRAYRHYVAHLRASRPVLVHSFMVHANLLARLARPLARIPVLVNTIQNVREGPSWRSLAYRITDRLADLVSHVSEAGAKDYVARRLVDSRRVRWIPNSVDFSPLGPVAGSRDRAELRAELAVAPEQVLLLAVGRLEPQKDYPTLLAAIQQLASQTSTVVLAVAGDGPLRGWLAAEAERLGIASQVRWLGWRRDISDLLRASDLFVLASRWEGTSIALLEAAAAGLAIVATAVGGTPEVVGGTMRLVAAGNAPALARAIAAELRCPPEDRTPRLALLRQRVLTTYDRRMVVAQWEAVYQELLGGR